MTELRKWKISDIGTWIKNAVSATLRGEFLMRMHVNRYFAHIVYTFILFWVSIWLSLQVEKSLTKVEENNEALSNIEIIRSQKTIDLAGYSKMDKIQQMLEEKGSKLTMPEKPANRIR